MRVNGVVAALAAGLMINSLVSPTAFAGDSMPVAQQNALVQKYCAVCHTDAARSGGLSLEHFDAAKAAPSLAAMMVSKLTSGVPLATVKAAASDPSAALLVARKMKTGAMGAAGIPVPDKATIDALVNALAAEATGASEWHVDRESILTASILREFPAARDSGEVEMYRLVIACDAASREGEMQLAWAPVPAKGTLSASVDGKEPVTYKVEGLEKISKGSQAAPAAAAISLIPRMALPVRSLLIANLFPKESVEFSFGDLPQAVRQSLGACFPESRPAR